MLSELETIFCRSLGTSSRWLSLLKDWMIWSVFVRCLRNHRSSFRIVVVVLRASSLTIHGTLRSLRTGLIRVVWMHTIFAVFNTILVLCWRWILWSISLHLFSGLTSELAFWKKLIWRNSSRWTTAWVRWKLELLLTPCSCCLFAVVHEIPVLLLLGSHLSRLISCVLFSLIAQILLWLIVRSFILSLLMAVFLSFLHLFGWSCSCPRPTDHSLEVLEANHDDSDIVKRLSHQTVLQNSLHSESTVLMNADVVFYLWFSLTRR